MCKDLLENDTDDDWELVPMSSLEDGKTLEIVVNDEGGDLRKTSVSDQQHLPSEETVEEDTAAAATSARVENENIPKSPISPLKRYNSPIFENLLPEPIEPVKLSSPTLCIPADNSIDNLLETASLVSRTTKPSSSSNPMNDDDEITGTTNTQIENVNDNVIEEVANNFDNDDDDDENKIDNDWLSLGTLVAEKRPSMQDPELVLMQNVVPGEWHDDMSRH